MRQAVKLSLFLSITGFVASVSPVMADDAKTVLALVNGTEITSDQIAQLPGINANVGFATLEDNKKAQIIIGLINRQLVLEQAKKEGFDRSEPIANAVNDMAETYIVKQYLVKVAAGTDLSKEALVAYYEDNFLGQPEQYEIAHILLATEDEANGVLGSLREGAGFSELARTKSKDKVSAEKGGDLGWFTSADLLPAFYKTASGLSRGEISSQPTKTQFGWHIVKLNDKRETAPQPLDQVKQGIKQALIEEEIAGYLDNLRESATIEIR